MVGHVKHFKKRFKSVRERFASQGEPEDETAIALKQQHKGEKAAMKEASSFFTNSLILEKTNLLFYKLIFTTGLNIQVN